MDIVQSVNVTSDQQNFSLTTPQPETIDQEAGSIDSIDQPPVTGNDDEVSSKLTSATVVNLSNVVLTSVQNSLLEKGLNFCPTPGEPDLGQLAKDLEKFHISLKRKAFFESDRDTNFQKSIKPKLTEGLHVVTDIIQNTRVSTDKPPFEHTKFKNPSTWVPQSCPANLETYIMLNQQSLQRFTPRNPKSHNLSFAERKGLEELKRNHNIVIKPADKGSAVVVMNTTDYITEAHRQLSDTNFYEKVDTDLTEKHNTTVHKAVNTMLDQGDITQKTSDYLKVKNPKTARFYLLPKIHKNKIPPPGRPIVSANDCPTEKISGLVDHFLNPIVAKTRSYIKDSTDFISRINDIKNLSPDTLLVTLDVSSLYTNIPNGEGIMACSLALSANRSTTDRPSVQNLIWLLKLTLRLNNFEFNGDHYIQTGGTAMGTRVAPSYANIFMDHLEQKLVYDQPIQPLVWWRYIDDIFCIWTKSREELDQFIDRLNSSHPTIKFTTEISHVSVNFLDTTVVLRNGSLYTTLYTKPTDKHNYLHYTSSHAHHCKEGGPYSQLLRVKRICTHTNDFEENAKMIITHFARRGYPDKLLQESLEKVRLLPRQDLLTNKSDKEETTFPNQVYMITDYNPANPKLGTTLRDNWELLKLKPETQALHDSKLIVGTRRTKNLKDHLVRAQITYPPSVQDQGPIPGPNICTRINCAYCPYIINEHTCRSNFTSRTYKTPQVQASCRSTNLVYYITCQKCDIGYVGETKRSIKERLYEHLRDIKKNLDSPVARHFNKTPHSYHRDVRIQVLEFIKQDRTMDSTTTYRRQREFWWIHQLKSLEPLGMNIFG